MNTHSVSELGLLASEARKDLVRIISQAKAAHIASSLSAIELFLLSLTAFGGDATVIVSKGHAAAGYYSCLRALGRMTAQELDTYGQDGSRLFGHVSKESGFGIPFSTGSLGHGLPYGVGRALSRKRRLDDRQVIVIASDGEMNEGTTWESALIAAHHNLDNLTLLVDRNGLQSIGHTEQTLALEPLSEKWRAFNWSVDEVDGHDLEALTASLSRNSAGKPKVLIAKTTKGKGVSFMENDNLWHYRPPTSEQVEIALRELGK